MEFMNVAEAASLLRIGERTAYTLVHEGRIPAVKVVNQCRIEKGAFEAWLGAGGDRANTPDEEQERET